MSTRLDLPFAIREAITKCLEKAGKSAKNEQIENSETTKVGKCRRSVQMMWLLAKPNLQVQVQALLLGEPEINSQFPGVQQYLDGLIQIEQLSACTICRIFGLDEATLKQTFKPIAKHLLALFLLFSYR